MIEQRIFELRGGRVVLRPLQVSDVEALAGIALDQSLWMNGPNRIDTAGDVRSYVNAALDARVAGTAIPFVTCLVDGTVVGSTRFGNIDEMNSRVEIGWTWISKAWQRTFVNTEAKYLMLRHAFDVWKCVRVELKTGSQNRPSRTAILRLGAREEGILRQHTLLPDGSYRDTVYYSILKDEWPDVRTTLEIRLSSAT